MTMKLFDDGELFSQQPQRNCDDKNAALLLKGRILSFFGRAQIAVSACAQSSFLRLRDEECWLSANICSICVFVGRQKGRVDRSGSSQRCIFRIACFEPEAFPVQGGRYTRFNYRPYDLVIV